MNTLYYQIHAKMIYKLAEKNTVIKDNFRVPAENASIFCLIVNKRKNNCLNDITEKNIFVFNKRQLLKILTLLA